MKRVVIIVLASLTVILTAIVFLILPNKSKDLEIENTHNIVDNNKNKEQQDKEYWDEVEKKQDEEIRRQETEQEEIRRQENLEYEMEQKRKEIEEKIKREKEERKQQIGDMLRNKGFNELNSCDENNKDSICFKKGDMLVSVDGSVWTTYYKRVQNLNNYQCNEDIKLINDTYDKKISGKLTNKICKIINSLSIDTILGFNINTNDLYINIANYGKDLEYNVSDGIKDEIDGIELNYIDTIIVSNKDNEKDNSIKELFYNTLMEEVKGKYRFYDYYNNVLNNGITNVCKVEYYNKNKYNFNSDFCHGGTSDTSFELEFKGVDTLEDDRVKINYKGEYYKNAYLELLKKDLDYFKNKLKINIDLSDENINRLKEFVEKDEKDLTLEINNNIKINIRHYPDYYYKDYEITYSIR